MRSGALLSRNVLLRRYHERVIDHSANPRNVGEFCVVCFFFHGFFVFVYVSFFSLTLSFFLFLSLLLFTLFAVVVLVLIFVALFLVSFFSVFFTPSIAPFLPKQKKKTQVLWTKTTVVWERDWWELLHVET